jgi:hypothetical protein
MIDLYGIPGEFPQLKDAEKLRGLPHERVAFLEHAFEGDVGDSRFIPYIQLHEYEAYLFSEPSQFRQFYHHHEKEIARLQAVADGFPTPEVIDDGQHSAPSKRIISELPDYEDAKPTVGPQVAELIGLTAIRAKCPHFNEWVSRLERLGP